MTKDPSLKRDQWTPAAAAEGLAKLERACRKGMQKRHAEKACRKGMKRAYRKGMKRAYAL